jgi:hypothetical protein
MKILKLSLNRNSVKIHISGTSSAPVLQEELLE